MYLKCHYKFGAHTSVLNRVGKINGISPLDAPFARSRRAHRQDLKMVVRAVSTRSQRLHCCPHVATPRAHRLHEVRRTRQDTVLRPNTRSYQDHPPPFNTDPTTPDAKSMTLFVSCPPSSIRRPTHARTTRSGSP
eukprot:5665159-Prymnesium_polylepis.2